MDEREAILQSVERITMQIYSNLQAIGETLLSFIMQTDWIALAQVVYIKSLEHFSEITVFQFSIVAGILQILGYSLYIRQSLRHELEPNPATWLMFAYGTVLLTILELDIGAEIELLILPMICAVLSIWVALLCWQRGSLGWPEHYADRLAFTADILLTLAYVTAWYLNYQGSISEGDRNLATTVFLVGSNASTFTAFVPILRDSYVNPSRERSLAWIVWTLAYALLGIATIKIHGFLSPLLVYPVSCAFLHLLVALLARPGRRRKSRS